jgi:mono/diheme cytochrome c family protein
MRLSIEMRALIWAVLAGLGSLGGTLLIASPIEKVESSSPATAWEAPEIVVSPQLAPEGAGFFGQSCGDCHGDDARGDEGPDLHNLTISNRRIETQIKNGVKGQMPSFSRKYKDQQVGALVAYLRTLK